jgi:hypothetical protein
MRNSWTRLFAILFVGGGVAFAQQPPGNTAPAADSKEQAELGNLFESKIRAEWEAIKHKDQKAYGDLLTEDFIGVEADREGERYKWKAVSELQASNVAEYTLSFLKVNSLCPDATVIRYEVFLKFPPKSIVPFEKILVGEVWVKRDGQWKVLHYQETKVK